jgi:hypothetical protein
VSRRAEAEQADAVAALYACYPYASKSDNSGAEQRRGMEVIKLSGQRENEIRASECILSVPAIHAVSRERRVITEILPAAPAIRAAAIHAAHPGNSDARALGQLGSAALNHFAYNLMPGNHRRHSRRQISLHNVQIGAAHTACPHSKEDVARRQIRQCDLFNVERERRDGLWGGQDRCLQFLTS